ncbi:YidH family protein [Psychromonas sp. 14N.309.X.WAT.B.A12]|uniref:YidH family protein n=1 Tax=unclassified Psychromonas TaxID=2614957 RepID=UPI0025B0D2BC|nr:DUF202 domain-containing protein [Psychromonas sp. 14N.309.X.WAT.B.A12]MDN2662182.1 DUF202 domain-containing protein [Psychromonas sp. 14N.309.X.WAT.B.A12]
MNKLPKEIKKNWRKQGEAPDYRFSLANERTYLAWIRTALALLAGAIGLDQLTPDLANPQIRYALSAFLCICSALLAIFAYRRWAANEASMRHKKALSYTSFIKVISSVVFIFSGVVILAVFL